MIYHFVFNRTDVPLFSFLQFFISFYLSVSPSPLSFELPTCLLPFSILFLRLLSFCSPVTCPHVYYLPASLSLTCLPACLTCLPACLLPACLPITCLPVYLIPVCLPVTLYVYRLITLPDFFSSFSSVFVCTCHVLMLCSPLFRSSFVFVFPSVCLNVCLTACVHTPIY